MADNTARARAELEGQRRAVREHTRKWHDYPDQIDKDYAWKTIQRVQGEIAQLKRDHPSLNTRSSEDDWRPGDRAL
ncbi:hypothetical protein [Microbacterium sp. NPDC076895]|uniref:hypothetical protein n=1 Tax=Microbacterium sp. NPDC076895 TaxID=3154957 RepID=UPI00343C9BB8